MYKVQKGLSWTVTVHCYDCVLVLSCWMTRWLSSCLLWVQRIAVIARDGYSSLQLGLKSTWVATSVTRDSLQKTWNSTWTQDLRQFLMIWFINKRTSFPHAFRYVTHPSCTAHGHNNNTMSARTTTAAALPFVIGFASRSYIQGANKRIANVTFAEWI